MRYTVLNVLKGLYDSHKTIDDRGWTSIFIRWREYIETDGLSLESFTTDLLTKITNIGIS